MNIEVEREHVVQALCAHYAQDHLTTGELESRFERANRAGSAQDLRTVLEGLPALGAMVAPPAPLYSVAPYRPTPTGGLAVNERRYSAIFAEVKKEGFWSPAPVIRSTCVFGSVIFDLREAAIPPEGILIDVDVTLGEAKVILPPGVGAEVECSAFLGSVDDKSKRASPGGPVVHITGGTILGSITVITKLPKPARMESWRKQLKAAFFGE